MTASPVHIMDMIVGAGHFCQQPGGLAQELALRYEWHERKRRKNALPLDYSSNRCLPESHPLSSHCSSPSIAASCSACHFACA